MTKLKLIFNLSSVQLTIPTMADLYDTLQSDITIAHSLPKDFTDDDMNQKYKPTISSLVNERANSLVMMCTCDQVINVCL